MMVRNILGFIAMLLLLSSCGSDSSRFRLEGRLRNLNQGEFWVYSPNAGLDGIDTIPVREGRFAYELLMRDAATLVIIFPNYSEQAVFAEPGATVTIKGDASHLKEMTITGTDENKMMTQLRMELNRLTPPEIPGAVENFIREHPTSPSSVYLLQRYFVLSAKPDYQKANKLTLLLLKNQPNNGQLIRMSQQLASVLGGKDKLPAFKATDVKGNVVSEQSLKGTVNVVANYASWSYTSSEILMRLRRLKKQYGEQLGVMAICLDANKRDCKQRAERDSLKWATICDGRMWQSPLLSKLGMANVPDNIVTDSKGRVKARGLDGPKLEEHIKKVLGEKK